MNEYKSLRNDRVKQIAYAQKHVPKKIIIQYQNAIGKSMVERTFISVIGFAGINKIETQLKI